MSIFRNRTILAVVVMLGMIGAPLVNAAAADEKKSPKPAETRQPSQRDVKTPVRNPPQSVFKPKEKISAGKSVSFPSDI
jgi:hypothetical protein